MYARRLDDRVLTFGVSGKLWNDALVIYDRETNTHWSHVTGEALEGELEGAQLEPIESVLMPFGEWKKKHPGSRVLARAPGSRDGSGYASYVTSTKQGIFGTQAKRDELPPKAIVQGVAYGGEAAAVSHGALRRKGTLTFTLADREFVARLRDDAVRVFRKDAEGELEPVPTTTAYWFAWLNFHPRAEVIR